MNLIYENGLEFRVINNRLNNVINRMKLNNEKCFMPFYVIGDPTPEIFISIIKRIEPIVDIIELGLPFSDPIADGPIIQEANKRSFQSGMNPSKGLELIKNIRKFTDKPIVLLTYANIVGVNEKLEQNIKKFSEVGIDGLIVADVPIEESRKIILLCHEHNIHFILLVTPSTTMERLKKIVQLSTSFIYLVSIKGITGVREYVLEETKHTIKRIRSQLIDLKLQDIPVYVGFGISKSEHVKEIINLGADGVIVGSAIIKIIQDFTQDPKFKLDKDYNILINLMEEFVIKMKNATRY